MGNRIKQLPEFQNQMNDHGQHAQTTIDLLRQYRHDVMNDLQLIRGFYQLKRTDQMLNSIQQAVDRAQKQTILSDFSDPNIAFVLLEADIMFPLIDLEIVSTAVDCVHNPAMDSYESLIDLEMVSTAVGDKEETYSPETVSRFRQAMQLIGEFSLKNDLPLLVDVEFLQSQVIQILIYGKHKDKNGIEALRSVFQQNDEKIWDLTLIEDHIVLKLL